MKTYVVMLHRNEATGDIDVRCRSDIDKHPAFKRLGKYVIYTNDNNIDYTYTIMFEGKKDIADQFKDRLKNLYYAAKHELINEVSF